MSGPKHSFRSVSNMTQQAGKTSTKEEELMEKVAQLSTVNAQLVQEVQKLKQGNATLVKRIVELSQRKFEASAENNRLKEVLKRVHSHMERFLPFLVQGSEVMDNVLRDLTSVSIPRNFTQRTPVSNEEGLDDVNCGGITPGSPQRTGIAMPMVKGHSISKPSISLQRVVPRQSATPCVPLPIRDLNLADIVRAEDQNRQLSEVREESDRESSEGNDDSSEENEHISEGNENRSGESEHNLLENEHSSEGNEHNAEENEHNSEENESGQLDRSIGSGEGGTHNLSVVEEESTFIDEASSGRSSEPQGATSPNLLPIIEENASSSQAGASSRVRQTKSLRLSRKKSKPEEDEVESSDDEIVELSLIAARSKLMNGDRRKELKEGTSKDYGAKSNHSPVSRRKLKRKKTQEDEIVNVEGSPNETSALRKSVDRLVSSLKKSRVSRSTRSINDSPSQVSRRVNGLVVDELDPRVTLVRMSSVLRSKPSGSGETAEEVSERPLSPNTSFTEVMLSPVEVPADVTLPLASPRAPSPIMVTKRRRCSYITTRNKRSARQPPPEDTDVVVVDEVDKVEEEVLPPPQRSGTKRRRSWKESIRKRNRSQLESDTSLDETEREGSEEQTTEGNNRTSVSTDELPTVVLNRCSDSFIALNSSKGAQDDLLNDSTNDNSNTSLAFLALRANSDNIPPGNVANGKVASKPARAKPRSKSKRKSRSKSSAKTANGVGHSRKRTLSEGLNAVEQESHNSLDPPSLNSSLASSIGDVENSRGSIGRNSGASRPRRAKAPVSLKEKPLNRKLRRS